MLGQLSRTARRAGLRMDALRRAVWAVMLAVAVTMAVGWAPGVQARPVPAGTTISNMASATYVPAGYTQTETISSNSVSLEVTAVEALTLTQSQSLVRPPGATVMLSHLLSNVGNTPSSYTFALTNNGPGCAGTTYALTNVQLVRDNNNNGTLDPADPAMTLGQPAVLSLQPGEVASLLVVGTVPSLANGTACLALSTTSTLQARSALNNDTVTVGSRGMLVLTESASYGGLVVPGVSDISFLVNGSSIGLDDVLPTGIATSLGAPVTVDGVPMSLVLIRAMVPTGTVYNANSLQTSVVGALKLYRTVDDQAFTYHQGDGGAGATEVAIGIPAAVARNSALNVQFSVRVRTLFTDNIVSNAQSFFADGANVAQSDSNTVVIVSTPASIGLAKAAGIVRANLDSAGQSDSTATVTFSLRVKNYGSLPLYGVQITDTMEGGAATQFGSYTTQAIPGVNQYTIVAGSVAVVNLQGGGTPGARAVPNAAFTGQTNSPNLLGAGALLPVGGEFTVVFDMRMNTVGRAPTLFNTATASAALVAGAPPSVLDVSTNGANPDPDGYGNPGGARVPTPVLTQAPALSVVQSVSLPRRVEEGVYDLDYTFKVANKGTSGAPNVRIMTNLNCTFNMDQPTGQVASWQLVGGPATQNGVLLPSANFNLGPTGCDRAAMARGSAPQAISLSLVDGTRSLMPGQSEVVKLTVRVIKKSAFLNKRSVFTSKAWVASLLTNSIDQSPSSMVAGSASSVDFFLIDPFGVVYNSITRQPVTGAVVTFKRNTCSASIATPLVPAEIAGADTPGMYTFNADGSMSMATGTDGAYQFFFNAPPVNDVCTYSISVAPPAGSGYVNPSVLIPAQAGTFTRCGAVVPNAFAPMGGDATTYFGSVRAGLFPGSKDFCEVLFNHLPLDPGDVRGLSLKKEGSKTQAEFGDFIDYALTISNKTGFPVTGMSFADMMPPGLAYVAGSARLNGQLSAEPAGGSGPVVTFAYPAMALAVDASATVRYRARIGVGAPTEGEVVNRAVATSGPMQSNTASFRTYLSGGVFADGAFAFGKVYMDCRRGASDKSAAEADGMGIPGVRLYLENGTFVITDAQGKWSLYGLKPVTHVLRLDQTTLPKGAVLGVLDNRNSGTPESRFLDLKKGDFHRADFVVTNCDDTAMRSDVTARRAALAFQGDIEAEAQVRLRFDPENRAVVTGDTRALPASNAAMLGSLGSLGSTAEMPISTSAPLIELPTSAIGNGLAGPGGNGLFAPLLPPSVVPVPVPLPLPVPAAVEAAEPEPITAAVTLEELTPELDSSWDFIGLADGAILPSQVINVRVKGEMGHSLRLSVNGNLVEERRVGKKVVLESKKLIAWEYIGVVLKPGANTLVLDAVDSFGIVRKSKQISVTAPDKLARIEIDLPALARADIRTPVVVGVRLTDVNGVPVTSRTAVTLEADRGQWLDKDLNPLKPGLQVFIEGGKGQFSLQPPGMPGDARVRVSANTLVKEVRLALLPEIRPMLGVGIVEGVLDFTKRGALTLGAMPAGAAFETELSGLHSNSDSARTAARSAFFFKGTVQGDYLLTAAFDSDKAARDRLFRDIRPEEFYPVYGDASIKGYDAQSSQRLYVRIDQNRSYLLYGDFTTTSSAEVRQLSQTNRTLTGVKNVYENAHLRATTYAARTAQTQLVEEFPSVGTSGPYFLNAGSGDLVINSEIVTIIVRDRYQPGLVMSTTSAVRGIDYTLEAFTRRLLFTHSIASVDSNLNPQSIRVTYEIDSGGAQFLVAGTDVQIKVSDQVQLGVVSSVDENPDSRRKLSALTALARLGKSVVASGEVVKTESDLKGTGYAARAELRQQTERLAIVVTGSKTTEAFDNPGASLSAGRTDAGARAEYKLNETTTLRGEAVYGQTVETPAQSRVSASVQKKFTETLMAEVGLNHGQTAGTAAGFNYGQTATYNGVNGGGGANNTLGSGIGAAPISSLVGSGVAPSVTTVRARLTTEVPGVPRAQVFVEGEQALQDSKRHTVAVGGNYAITDKTRAYGRYELVSMLDQVTDLASTQPHNTGIFGIESNYMEGGRVYNEYRLADAAGGSPGQAAMGVRNAFKVSDEVRLTAGIEQTKTVGGKSSNGNTGTGLVGGVGNSTAVISGVEYMTSRLKASGIGELRRGSDTHTYLVSAGIGYKLDANWSLLARSVVTDSQGQGINAGNNRRLMRNQLGVALRPGGQDVWNALARYEHKLESVSANGLATAPTSITGLGGIGAPGVYSTDVISAHLNVNPARGNYVTARYAGKVSRADDGLLASRYWAHLLQGRYTRDLAPDWDVSVQAGLLYGKGGALQKTLGLEGGYQAARNIWVSVGYNAVGLSDRDLTGADYTSKGAYIRLRFKFDENTLGFGAPARLDNARVAKP